VRTFSFGIPFRRGRLALLQDLELGLVVGEFLLGGLQFTFEASLLGFQLGDARFGACISASVGLRAQPVALTSAMAKRAKAA